MRNPRRKVGYWLALGLAGGSAVLAAACSIDWLGDLPSGLIFGIGGACAAFGLVGVLMAVPASIGYARLMSGRGVIERWRVTPDEWDRFRAFDISRAAQGPTLDNDMLIRNVTPPQGVDVIVGRTQIIVDGSYHTLRPLGLPELRAIGWLNAPVDPECLEFSLLYPAGRYGGARRTTLRVPVARAAREAAVRTYHHFHARIPEFKPGLAYRRPRLVIGGGIALLLVSLAVSGVGWLLDTRGVGGDLPSLLMPLGLVVAFFALFVTGLVTLIVQPWKKK